jgi:hypothetical protein
MDSIELTLVAVFAQRDAGHVKLLFDVVGI